MDYEFPKPSKRMRSDDDANWMKVRLRVTEGGETWERHAPCLYSWSFLGMATWLRGVADGTADRLWYYPSVEENLALNWDRDGADVLLKLLLSQEFRLPQTGAFQLRVRQGALRRFADDLERDIAAFPIRTWGEDPSTERIARRFNREMLRL